MSTESFRDEDCHLFTFKLKIFGRLPHIDNCDAFYQKVTVRMLFIKKSQSVLLHKEGFQESIAIF